MYRHPREGPRPEIKSVSLVLWINIRPVERVVSITVLKIYSVSASVSNSRKMSALPAQLWWCSLETTDKLLCKLCSE